MDAIRQKEKQIFLSNQADLQQGLQGVKLALKLLRDYYAKDTDHEAAVGAGSGVIGLIEVVESDFSKNLAEITADEDTAQGAYDRETKENALTKATKDQDVKYKTKEATHLDSAVAEMSSDLQGVDAELAAILEYKGKLVEMCVAKAEPYEERKRRREEEIAGLKQALQILEGESVLMQTQKKGLRGATH